MAAMKKANQSGTPSRLQSRFNQGRLDKRSASTKKSPLTDIMPFIGRRDGYFPSLLPHQLPLPANGTMSHRERVGVRGSA